MKCMLLYLEVMGGVEEVHCFKMPPPIRPYFLIIDSYDYYEPRMVGSEQEKHRYMVE